MELDQPGVNGKSQKGPRMSFAPPLVRRDDQSTKCEWLFPARTFHGAEHARETAV